MYEVGVDGIFYSIYSKVSAKNLPPITYQKLPNMDTIINVPYGELISKKQVAMGPPALRSEP